MKYFIYFSLLIGMIFCNDVFAATATHEAGSIGEVAARISKSFAALGSLIAGASYLAGMGFSIGAIMKFKQHKDNPTQIPIGTPIALVFIATALLFLPSLLNVAGKTMFGTGYKTAGPTGVIKFDE